MDKINFGSTIPAYPIPVSLLGTHVNGKPYFLAVAWFTIQDVFLRNPIKRGRADSCGLNY